MTSYPYFDLGPKNNEAALDLESALSAIVAAFPQAEIDELTAAEEAKKRAAALAEAGAPPDLVAMYEEPRVVRVRVTGIGFKGAHLQFDLWDCQGIIAHPDPPEETATCEELAKRMASVLGYTFSIAEYD